MRHLLMKSHRGKRNFSAGGTSGAHSRNYLTISLQLLVVLVALVLIGSLIDHFFINPSVSSFRAESTAPTKVERHIQISVRNECGVGNVAMAFTNYLRKRGFDVVETDNGSVFNRKMTTVVDATGNYNNALRVAEALGVQKENVITELDPHAYVDVEVLIGTDYVNLKPREGIE